MYPITNLANVLMAAYSSSRGLMNLFTNNFFASGERVTLVKIGEWTMNRLQAKIKNFQWFPEKLKDFSGQEVRRNPT